MRWLILITGVALLIAGLVPGLVPTEGDGDRQALSLIADPATRRETASGPVVGGVAPGGTQVWLGIPYAAAPVAELRWRAPQAPAAWSAAREATSFGAVCPQFASALSASEEAPGALIGSEDCLSLNVFAPAGVRAGTQLPVMVFVHGGGNTIGSSIPYDGSVFAQEQGVLMVTLNYRLGPLGWFSYAPLRNSAADALDASGNFALLDIVAALTWVRDNIEAFGGDPGRVTVFGESAGARNIYSLLAAPQAAGLFHGAIIQSGFPGSFTRERAEHAADALQPGEANSSHEWVVRWLQGEGRLSRSAAETRLARLPEADIPAFLRSLSVEDILAPVAGAGGMYRIPALFRDGTVLPVEPLPDVLAGEAWNRVPLLVGSNRDEMKLFLALSERHVSRRFGLFPAPVDPNRYALLSRYHSDGWKAAGVDLPLAAISRSNPDAALYAYRFDWDDMRRNWLLDLPELLGAAHALELDFLFGPLIAEALPGVFHRGNRDRREALGKSLRDYWAGFAYNGRPGSGRSGGQPTWPRWSLEAPQLMLLDEAQDGGVRPQTLLLTVEALKAELATEDGLPLRQRCALYVDLYLANSGLTELFSAREYQALGCAPFPSWSLAGMSR